MPNAEKILSLYEDDIHMVVRGKASAEIEFGNSLFIVETAASYIFDHQLSREAAPGGAQWLRERYPLMQQKTGGRPCGVTTDRGFDSKRNRNTLKTSRTSTGSVPASRTNSAAALPRTKSLPPPNVARGSLLIVANNHF